MAKILYLDESGDHSLSKIDPQYPIFVLGGIITEDEYATNQMEQAVQDFKAKLFGLILHTADIVRQRNGFEKLVDSNFRQKFYAELNKLMRSLEYKVVACAIKKDAHAEKYGIFAIDPYFLSLNVLVERFCFEIGGSINGGTIIAEKRNPTFDNQLELAWLNLKVSGTKYLQAVDVSNRVNQLTLVHKKRNIAGLQLADLIVSPAGRFVLGKKSHDDFSIIEEKFRRLPESPTYRGSGLIILPK